MAGRLYLFVLDDNVPMSVAFGQPVASWAICEAVPRDQNAGSIVPGPEPHAPTRTWVLGDPAPALIARQRKTTSQTL
ncbi:MAG: hypothetical protein M3151_14425 [Actinomycetota bacterium]|nr:hypothetical protein [Actinomycetota bacterium]